MPPRNQAWRVRVLRVYLAFAPFTPSHLARLRVTALIHLQLQLPHSYSHQHQILTLLITLFSFLCFFVCLVMNKQYGQSEKVLT